MSDTTQTAPQQRPVALPERIRYSIVVPCYNEQDSIVPLIEEIIAVIGDDSTFEIVIVDDGSTDQTRSRLAQAKNRLAVPFRAIVHAVNCGQSAAIYSGVDAAGGEWIITLDGDGQNDPGDIPNLINTLDATTGASGSPIICGHRTTRRDPWVRKLSSMVANIVRSRLLNDATPDTGCGLKLFRRDAFMRLPRFDHMHRFLPALMLRDGGVIVSVAVGHRPRRTGQSNYGIHNRLWSGIVDLIGVMWLRRRQFKSTNYEEL